MPMQKWKQIAVFWRAFETDGEQSVWMSHGDRVESLPQGFQTICTSANSPSAAMANEDNSFMGSNSILRSLIQVADRESLKTLFTIFVVVEMIGILEILLKKTSKKFRKRLAMIRFFSDYQVVLIPQL